MKIHLHRSLCRDVGATMTEMMLLLLLVAMVVMAGIKLLGGGIGEKVEFANDSVSAVSIDDNEMEQLRENQRRAEAKRERSGGSASKGAQAAAAPAQPAAGGAAAGGASASQTRTRPGAPTGARTQPSVQPKGGCAGGFNPFAIPIALGLLGLLGYVVVKSQKG